jgi:ADP-ribose pyrophosphatase YjhB (NUDIX family)
MSDVSPFKLISSRERPYADPGEKTFGFSVETETWSDGVTTQYRHKACLPDGVLVMAFTPHRDIIMVEEFQPVKGGTLLLSAVGYGIPDGATPEAAARIGLSEKTGYRAGRLEQLTTIVKDAGRVNGVIHFFVAMDCLEAASPKTGIKVSVYPFESAKSRFMQSMFENPTVPHDGPWTLQGFGLASEYLKRLRK